MSDDQADDGLDWIRPVEAARMLNVTPRTLLRWADEGRISTRRTPVGGHRRYRRSEILGLMPERQALDDDAGDGRARDSASGLALTNPPRALPRGSDPHAADDVEGAEVNDPPAAADDTPVPATRPRPRRRKVKGVARDRPQSHTA